MTRLAVALSWMMIGIAAGSLAAQQPSGSPAPEATRAIVKSYLEIQGHLAADRFADVKGPARTLASQAAALGKEGAPLAKVATAFAAAADLKAARDAFGPLSDALIARVRAAGSAGLSAELRIGYCPMARKSWLQREEQVRNPYYGAAMLTCGDVKPVK